MSTGNKTNLKQVLRDECLPAFVPKPADFVSKDCVGVPS